MSRLSRASAELGGMAAALVLLYIAARLGAPYAWPTLYVVSSLCGAAVFAGLTAAGVSWICRVVAVLRSGGRR